jgi:hypothetical protein
MEAWTALPMSLRHPKNLATLAIQEMALPADRRYQVMIMSSQPWTAGRTYVEVRVPGGMSCEVDIVADDDPASLIAKIERAIDAVLDAGRPQGVD